MDRPPKVLHIGNINENAYLNAKFLRSRGIEADVLVYDYRHVNGYPEWEDGIFSEEHIPQESDTNWQDYLKDFRRPKWFIEVNHYIPSFLKKNLSGAKQVLLNDLKYVLLAKLAHPQNWHYFLEYSSYARNIEKTYWEYVQEKDVLEPSTLRQSSRIKQSFQDLGTFLLFRILGKEFRRLFESYDIIQAYSLEPILVALSGTSRPFISFEHGTLKRIPLENNLLGKLLANAYHTSQRVIITNTHTKNTAQKIGLTNYTFIPHPLDTEKFKKEETPLYAKLRKDHSADIIFFSPTRYSPLKKGSDKFLKAFAEFVKSSEFRVKLILCSWGGEREELQNMVKKLGIMHYTILKPMLPKMLLRDYYNAADIVFDQFVEGAMGTIAPEAMACGKPLVMHYNPSLNKWAFPKDPPIIEAFTSEEIYGAMRALTSNASLRKNFGLEGRRWVERYHSRDLVTKELVTLYEDILRKK